MKPTVTDSDQGNELIVVVLDEQDLPIADLEFRRVGHFQCLISDGAAEQADRVRRTGLAFDAVVDVEGNVSLNMALTALAFPDRTRIGNRALKNQFGLLNKLLKGWRNHRCCRNASKRQTGDEEREKIFYFHVGNCSLLPGEDH